MMDLGSGHWYGSNTKRQLMQWPFLLIQLVVTGAGAACSPAPSASAPDRLVAEVHQPPDPDASPSAQIIDVEQFARKDFFEGVPYDEAAHYGLSDLPKLKVMLSDPAEVDHWPTIVGVIGAIGGRDSSETLIAFVESLRGRSLEPKRFQAGMSAVSALGYVRNGGEETAVAYLTEIVRASRTAPPPANLSELRIDPSIAASTAVQALALSGQPSAEHVLNEVARDAAWSAKVDAVEALQTLKQVRAVGLAGYLAAEPS